MKRVVLKIFIILLSLQVALAQQKPQYTQYFLNPLLLNPAVTGIENYTDVKAGYRSQWAGIDGAPVTTFLTLSMPLGKNYLNSGAKQLDANGNADPRGNILPDNYIASIPHHGIGLIIVSDQAGPISQNNIAVAYAYHLTLTAKSNLALGLMAGFSHFNINTLQLNPENTLDPAIFNGKNSNWEPDLRAGIWYYNPKYFIGLSVTELLPQSLYFVSNNTHVQPKIVPQLYANAGMKFFLGNDMIFTPSVLLKKVDIASFSFDVNAKILFKNIFWLGGSYRHNNSFSALTGINVNTFINIAYSYDITTSSLNTLSNGSHEIMLSILLNNKLKHTSSKRLP